MAQSVHSASTALKVGRSAAPAVVAALSAVVPACAGSGEDYSETEDAVRQALAQEETIPSSWSTPTATAVEVLAGNGDVLTTCGTES